MVKLQCSDCDVLTIVLQKMKTWKESALFSVLLIVMVRSQETSSFSPGQGVEEDASDEVDSSWELVRQFERTSAKCSWVQESVHVRGTIEGSHSCAGVQGGGPGGGATDSHSYSSTYGGSYTWIFSATFHM